MTQQHYMNNFIEYRYSNALHAQNSASLSKHACCVVEVDEHPPFSKILKMKIVKVRARNKSYVHVLLGGAECKFIDGIVMKWFEIAYSFSKDKDELEVWRDLHGLR